MPDIFTLWAGAATLGTFGFGYLWLSTRIDRDEATADLRREELVVEAMEHKVKALREDNGILTANSQRLRDENTELQRENGRFAAEIRQLKQEAERRKQPRDPKTGRMLPKPGAKRPRKPAAAQSGSATTN